MSIIGNYDVIVIGVGIGGVSAAGMTAKEGKNLLVVDQRPALGGGVCHSFEREGYIFDFGTIMSHLLTGLLMTIRQMINKWMP